MWTIWTFTMRAAGRIASELCSATAIRTASCATFTGPGSFLLLCRLCHNHWLATPCMWPVWASAMGAARFVLAKLWVATTIFALLVAFWFAVARMWAIWTFTVCTASWVAAKARLATAICALWHTVCHEVLVGLHTAIKRCLPRAELSTILQPHCPPEAVFCTEQGDVTTVNTSANTGFIWIHINHFQDFDLGAVLQLVNLVSHSVAFGIRIDCGDLCNSAVLARPVSASTMERRLPCRQPSWIMSPRYQFFSSIFNALVPSGQ
mmetsp:Transcript_42170/g.75494  ORF Transcript_42170/g.75494 Transcript_42170/m.75494 type:complete len:264 (+) Transcript_42170:426-1217(+)